ncbi:MAG: efflux RND transporter periplasmic adaptor subunit [Betaproteobacteria bacterium]
MKPGHAALILLSLMVFAACSEGSGKKKAEPPPVPVTTAKATERDIPVTLQVVGRAEAYESVILKARVDGQVATVLFTEGQHVKKDEVLIRLDPTDFAARQQQAAAASARDEALVAKSRADTARYTALKERKFVSEEKVNDVRTNEAAAVANLKASKAAEEVARLQHSYATIRAPFPGIVGARLVFPGSSIKINETILAVVNRIQPLLVSFSLPEKHLPRLREAMKSGPMKVDITLPGDASQSFEGEVHFIDNAVDPTTGTILMKARIPNTDEKLTSGQFLNVTLVLDTLKNAVSIPNEAVQQGAEGNFVYVVKADNSVEMRKIETIAANAGMTAISKGMQVDETVVTDGQLRLAPGVKVRIKDPSAATAPSDTGIPAAAK